MAEPIAVLFADSHLQEGAWSGQAIRGDALFALAQIVDYAVRHRVNCVVGAGDLIDKQRNRALPITAFHRQLDRLARAAIPFYYLQGQHDYDDPPWLSGHHHAVHAHGREFAVGDLTAYGLDFQAHGTLQAALDEIPAGTDLLFAHQVWGDWMGTITLPQGNFADIPVVSAVVTGDYHQVVAQETHGKDGQALTVYSPGATCLQKIDEPPLHYFLTLRDDGTFAFRRLKSRVVLESPVLNRPEDLDQFLAGLEEELTVATQKAAALDLPPELLTPLLRVSYSYRLSDASRRIERAVARRAHLFETELAPEAKRAPARVRGAAVADPAGDEAPVTLLTELAKVLDPADDSEAHDLMARLLEASDPRQALAAWRSEFMES